MSVQGDLQVDFTTSIDNLSMADMRLICLGLGRKLTDEDKVAANELFERIFEQQRQILKRIEEGAQAWVDGVLNFKV